MEGSWSGSSPLEGWAANELIGRSDVATNAAVNRLVEAGVLALSEAEEER